MTAWVKLRAGAVRALGAALLALALSLVALQTMAEDRAQVLLPGDPGFGRIVLAFRDRTDLPGYRVRVDNNVLVVTFDTPIAITAMPDVAVGLPDYVTIARVDPDGRGLRLGLRAVSQVSTLEAGEQLFIDLLPPGWAGLPPALPASVVADLAQRATVARQTAEELARAAAAKEVKPAVALRVGRNPTFYRLEFSWTAETQGSLQQTGHGATVRFDWPVPLDLSDVLSTMPGQLVSVKNEVGIADTRLELQLADGVTPRFYSDSSRHFTLDIDTGDFAGLPAAATHAATDENAAAELAAAPAEGQSGETLAEGAHSEASAPQTRITPVVSDASGTVRIAFPFDDEVPAAAFRRGDTLWLIFDTNVQIDPLAASPLFDRVASGFASLPAGDAQTVRIDLSTDRLSSLNSEGRSWVVSIGDQPLNPTSPVALNRRRDMDGRFEMVADLQRPSRVHVFEDPEVGDTLEVVTALPPAVGLTRDLSHVDFDALHSIHGLVIRPKRDGISVAIAGPLVQVGAPDGLRLSSVAPTRPSDLGEPQSARKFYVDLNSSHLNDLTLFSTQEGAILDRASGAEGRDRELARLDLADFYVSNQLAQEAIGVLKVLDNDLKSEDLKGRLRLTRAIADVAAQRPTEALGILNSAAFGEQVDPLIWRTIAKADVLDWSGARADAMAAETVIESYPVWVQARFLFASARSALESDDPATAARYLSMLPHSTLSGDDMSLYTLLTARVEERQGQLAEALDAYGQVVAADRRPTRAEAVYRTLMLLDRQGKLDVAKAATTLSAEVLMWRGGPLEAEMQSLLADLYFRGGNYRDGFATVKDAVMYHPDSPPISALLNKAGEQFGRLYLDGDADALPPIEALAIYYDYREFTPPGARGDEMIRNLTRRLVGVDLLQQAGDLLQYQVENRLKGAARAQVAADLAVIRLADRQPEAALKALNLSALADLPPTLDRQRRVLEARAMIDAGRYDLALDMLNRLDGRDVMLLRADAQWAAKRYDRAAELMEQLQEPLPLDGKLSQPARRSLVKAAVGYVLAGDTIGASRLRSKFSGVMSQSPEWPLFDFVTAETTRIGPEFRQVTREISGLDLLDSFLGAYRQAYGTDAAPLKAKPSPASV